MCHVLVKICDTSSTVDDAFTWIKNSGMEHKTIHKQKMHPVDFWSCARNSIGVHLWEASLSKNINSAFYLFQINKFKLFDG